MRNVIFFKLALVFFAQVSAQQSTKPFENGHSQFDKDTSMPSVQPNLVLYEAEDAFVLSKAEIVSDTLSSGNKYVYLNKKNAKITWELEAPSDGTYTIDVRYGVGFKKRPLTVNNVPMGDIEFGSPYDWRIDRYQLDLTKGKNTVTFDSGLKYMSFDYLELHLEVNKEFSPITPIPLLFPNPTQDDLIIDGLKKGDVIIIYDGNGREVLNFKALSEKELLDVSELTAGIYSISISGRKPKNFLKI